MAYQALYRKYRPVTFSDVIGQEHITKTLKNELYSNKIVHAYLFTGTRGTGKTTCAKILAKAVNCLSPIDGDPCGECEMCRAIANGEVTDIYEIDAASNNGVDDIRDLRDQVNFLPSMGKYRVYIIDEVHMLSLPAFNALLKTLEEPPEHVIFILATTEVHKLPATILSRCQRFDFRRIDPEKICERIQSIAHLEGLTVTDDAATLIAAAADGGMRDALSILDLCSSNNTNIDEDVVASVCAMAGNDYLFKLADLIKVKDTENALLLIDELHNTSVDMIRLLAEIIRHYRDLMIVKTVKGDKKPIVCSKEKLIALQQQADKYDIREIMAILGILQASTANIQNGNRRCEMEMAIIRLCNPTISNDTSSLEMRIAALESGNFSETKQVTAATMTTAQVLEDVADLDDFEIPMPEEENPPAPEIPSAPVASSSPAAVEKWIDVISILKKTCPLIAGVLEGSSAYISGDRLLIDTQSSQFKTMFNGSNPIYRDSIRKAAAQVLGQTYKLGPYRPKMTDEGEDPLLAFAKTLEELENK